MRGLAFLGVCVCFNIIHTHTELTCESESTSLTLLKKVREIRPEVNVSQICRDALEEYVRKSGRVAAQVADDGIEAHLARIGESDLFPLAEPDWEGLALEDARDWLAKATPEDWDRYLGIRSFLEHERTRHGSQICTELMKSSGFHTSRVVTCAV